MKTLNEIIKPPKIDKTVNYLPKGHYDDMDENALDAIFHVHGFRKIGVGSKARVYRHPDYQWIIKCFDDDDYMKYLNWVMAHQSNKFVPQIRGHVINITPNLRAVRMEPLGSFNRNTGMEPAYAISSYVENCSTTKGYHGMYDNQTGLYARNEEIPDWRTNKDLEELGLFLARNISLLDIHWGNVMYRVKTGHLVVTDPFYTKRNPTPHKGMPDNIKKALGFDT